MIVACGCFSRNASASRAVMKSPETNSPVPSMKKQRSASPSHGIPISALPVVTRSTMSTDKADIGIAWDGDADRCFFIDGTGEFISGDFITALLAEAFLLKHPGATIISE